MRNYLGWTALLAVVALAAASVSPVQSGEKGKIAVVLIDGQNNHNWRATTPILKKALEETGRFTVDVSSNLKPGDKPGTVPTVHFPPDLNKYQVVVSNYNGASWPQDFQTSLNNLLKDAKIGLVIVHAANNAFGGWKEYNQMIGMGWRDKKFGERLKVDDSGKEIRVPAGEDQSTGHRYTGPFKIIVRDAAHPITKGMPKEWLHARDELYDNLRGPAQHIHLLATGLAPAGKGTGVQEPMIFTITYGKGRVFHTPMGHDVEAMRCIGFIGTLQRGTEWAATGHVTLPLPANFPTADKTSSESAK